MITLVATIVAGLVQTGPDVCRVDLLHPDHIVESFETKCEYIIDEELL